MKDLVVLLGSGATFPEIPGVWKITEDLVAWSQFRTPEGGGAPPEHLVAQPGDVRPAFFRWLQEQYVGYWRERDAHFEELIHACELLAMLYPHPPNPNAMDRGKPPIIPLINPCPSMNNGGYGYLVQAACNEVLRMVSAACDLVEQRGHHPLGRLLHRLGNEYRLKVFSLNYDDVPDRSGLDFETGYGHEPFEFDPRRLYRNHGHQHVQLHGSVLFGDSELGYLNPRYPSRAEALAHRQSFGTGAPLQDGQVSHSLAMITGLRKADKTLPEPYGSYFAYLRHALLTTPRLLVIGYGGSDQHVNAALSSALRVTSPEVTVVDYFDFGTSATAPAEIGYPLGDKLFALLSWHRVGLHHFFANGAGLKRIGRRKRNVLASKFRVSFDGVAHWANAPRLPI